MINYNLATYQPISYEQWAAPVKETAAAHTEVEDGLGVLATLAAVWEKLANSALDKNEYAIYSRYRDNIKAAAEELMRNGLNSQSRTLLNLARVAYGSQIQPISDAWIAREKLREQERQEDVASGNSIIRDRSAYDRGLSEFYNGVPDSPSINLKTIADGVGSYLEPLTKALSNIVSTKKISPFEVEVMKQYGLSQQDINNFIAHPDDPNNNTILRNLYLKTIVSSGIDRWLDKEKAKRAFDEAFNVGILRGVGELKREIEINEAAKMRYSNALALARERQKMQWEMEAAERKAQLEMQKEALKLKLSISSLVNIQGLTMPKDIKRIDAMLDSNGHLKVNLTDITAATRSSITGAITSTYGQNAIDKNGHLKSNTSTYKDIKEILETYGYDTTNLNKLKVSEIEQILVHIKEEYSDENDALHRQYYTVPLSNTGTKAVIQRMTSQGTGKANVLSSMRNGKAEVESADIAKYDEDTLGTGIIYTDINNGKVWMRLNGIIYDIGNILTSPEKDMLRQLLEKMPEVKKRRQECMEMYISEVERTGGELPEDNPIRKLYLLAQSDYDKCVQEAKKLTFDMAHKPDAYGGSNLSSK